MIETQAIMSASPEIASADTGGRPRPLPARLTAVRTRPILTVAAIVECGDRYLFVEEQTRAGLRLNQPAGHVEAGESIAAAAVRETLEESAWDVEPVALVGVYHWEAVDRGASFVRFTFAATARCHHPERSLDTGIVRALWLSYDESVTWASRHRSPLVLRSLDDYRSGVRWPLDVIARL